MHWVGIGIEKVCPTFTGGSSRSGWVLLAMCQPSAGVFGMLRQPLESNHICGEHIAPLEVHQAQSAVATWHIMPTVEPSDTSLNHTSQPCTPVPLNLASSLKATVTTPPHAPPQVLGHLPAAVPRQRHLHRQRPAAAGPPHHHGGRHPPSSDAARPPRGGAGCF